MDFESTIIYETVTGKSFSDLFERLKKGKISSTDKRDILWMDLLTQNPETKINDVLSPELKKNPLLVEERVWEIVNDYFGLKKDTET
jgi:hypothetical protein